MRPMGWIMVLMIAMTLSACGTSEPLAECDSNQDCTGDPGAGCEWLCIDHHCEKSCPQDCTKVADCLDLPWDVKCLGHWACEEGLCVQVCDDVACGDGSCDPEGGETAASCAMDCQVSCQAAQDCETLPWPLQCPGHWECREGECVPVCDAQPECLVPRDCADHQWGIWCYGHWSCEEGQCIEVCDDTGCGDGLCDLDGGETSDSCQPDCRTVCEAPVDCVGLTWDIRCVGNWECENGLCEEVCDDVGCGNGICDVQGGESAQSCPLDCTQECRAAVDCLDHEWNIFCQGHWDCENGRCVEVCDFVGCGDGQCDREGGESPQSCPDDCSTACVDEGFPTGIPPACCSGLDALADCVPDQACPGSLLFCVDCGNRSCDPHENPYNCLDDCPQGCPVGEELSYQCPNGPEVDWCVCRPPGCQPVCLYIGTRSEGWYDSCTDELIDWAFCSDDDVAHRPVCLHIGTESEGWYDETSGEWILWDYCAPLWECVIDPKTQCL